MNFIIKSSSLRPRDRDDLNRKMDYILIPEGMIQLKWNIKETAKNNKHRTYR